MQTLALSMADQEQATITQQSPDEPEEVVATGLIVAQNRSMQPEDIAPSNHNAFKEMGIPHIALEVRKDFLADQKEYLSLRVGVFSEEEYDMMYDELKSAQRLRPEVQPAILTTVVI